MFRLPGLPVIRQCALTSDTVSTAVWCCFLWFAGPVLFPDVCRDGLLPSAYQIIRQQSESTEYFIIISTISEQYPTDFLHFFANLLLISCYFFVFPSRFPCYPPFCHDFFQLILYCFCTVFHFSQNIQSVFCPDLRASSRVHRHAEDIPSNTSVHLGLVPRSQTRMKTAGIASRFGVYRHA